MINEIQPRNHSPLVLETTNPGLSSGQQIQSSASGVTPEPQFACQTQTGPAMLLMQLMQPLVQLLDTLLATVSQLCSDLVSSAGDFANTLSRSHESGNGPAVAARSDDDKQGGGIWSTLKSVGSELLQKVSDSFGLGKLWGDASPSSSGVLGWVKNLF